MILEVAILDVIPGKEKEYDQPSPEKHLYLIVQKA